MDTRKIIDYAQDGNAVGVRESLYASIWDRVHAAIEAKKQEIAQNLVAQESYEGPGDDEEEDDWDEEDEQIDEGVRSWLVGKVAKHGGMIPREVANVIVSNLHKSAPEKLRKHPNYNRMTKELHQHISGAKDAEEAVRRSTDKNYLRSLEKKHISDITEEIEHLDEISDKAKRDYLSKVPASVTKIQKDAEREITTNPDQGKGLSNALKGLAKINKRGEMAAKVRQSLKSEAYDDDEDPDVRIADKELKKRGVTLPKVKVDPDKDMARLAKRTPKEKEDD
jgi:hypothetical protein